MSDFNQITGKQIAAARALVGIGQIELAKLANVSAPTLRRMEASEGEIKGIANNLAAVVRALEKSGVAFLDGSYSGVGGPGVRLRVSAGSKIDTIESEMVQYTENIENDAPPGAGG